ncbi:type II secretion system protein GspD [Veillonella sp. R32]|uniref:type II secretion system protein GspD n=1 Tax=Veillonella sp. R32 TaxID=2021312 RepID=UPI00138A18EF|nr:secretin N-terminal domain-containing protein [Veillonella sp. R32]KAF1682871.1 secretion protein [Veillonella sp. R32]
MISKVDKVSYNDAISNVTNSNVVNSNDVSSNDVSINDAGCNDISHNKVARDIMGTVREFYKYLKIVLWLVCFLQFHLCGESVAALSMTVNNGSLAGLVQSIARSEGMAITGTETLAGNVSIRLNEPNGITAIQRLARLKHFTFYEEDGLWVVDGNGMGDKEARVAHIISPKHMSALALSEALQAIVATKNIRVVKGANQVIIYGTPAELRQVHEVLPTLDRAPKQVRLEVAVVAFEHSYLKETGIQWSWQSITGHGEDDTNSYGGIRFGRAPSGLPYTFWFKPEIKAQATTDKTVLIARPSIMALNGEEAKILIGDRIPVLEEVKDGTESRTTTRYEEAGIRLTYTPFVAEDHTIEADIHAEVSSPALVSEMKAYRITTREAHTKVNLQSGEVLVIGGLMDNREGKQFTKIPILGDIPLLGKLFQHARRTKDKVELCIFVKAIALDDPKRDSL